MLNFPVFSVKSGTILIRFTLLLLAKVKVFHCENTLNMDQLLVRISRIRFSPSVSKVHNLDVIDRNTVSELNRLATGH